MIDINLQFNFVILIKVKDKLLHPIHQLNVQQVVQVIILIHMIVRYFIIVMVRKRRVV